MYKSLADHSSRGGSPRLGVLAARGCGVLLGALHAWLCSPPRVDDVAVGIALMLFGMGLSFYLGKPLIQPEAPLLPAIELGGLSEHSAVRDALRVNTCRHGSEPASWLARISTALNA